LLPLFVCLSFSRRTLFSTSGAGTISLPASLCPVDATQVHVSALSHVADIESLYVEPLTSTDWMLIEQKATWLENGGLLEQVSLVYKHQVIDLYLGSLGTAQLQVVPSNFEKSSESPWPVASDGVQNEMSACYRLVADTQIVVAPKPVKRNETVSISLQVVPSRDEYNEATVLLAKEMDVTLVRVKPCSAMVHPSIVREFSTWSIDDHVRYASLLVSDSQHGDASSGNAATTRRIVQVFTSDSVAEGAVGK
jgi:Peroxisome biogenesis factor 1, N-terminal